ncbi:hypothetical protein AAVH_11032 [Aphelenchoides avenae]|nr:hypothetical protein AAVH_11032 [Aphelenchus avenae]
MSLAKEPTLFKCPTCGKEFSKYSSLRSHRETHNDVPHACDQCEKKYKRRGDLCQHKRTAHAEDGKFECDECGKIFPHKKPLTSHKRFHREARKGKLNECDQCGKKYKRRTALLEHKRNAHAEDRQLQCDECGKLCPNKLALHRHKRYSRFTCDSECGLHSATRSEYLEHLRHQHVLQHPVTCKCASVDVKRAQQVAKHLGQTTLVEPDGTMKCIDGDCDFATTCARQMESHKDQRHHDFYQPVLRCGRCDTWFTSLSNLTSHNANMHQGERRYKCDVCGFSTNFKSHFIRHLTSYQQGKAEKQLQLIDEAFKQLMDCCLAPMTTGLPASAVQKVSAVKKASVQPFEALVAECLK